MSLIHNYENKKEQTKQTNLSKNDIEIVFDTNNKECESISSLLTASHYSSPEHDSNPPQTATTVLLELQK
jgi:hypothetical protein